VSQIIHTVMCDCVNSKCDRELVEIYPLQIFVIIIL